MSALTEEPTNPPPRTVVVRNSWRYFASDLFRRSGRAAIEWLAHSLLIFSIICCVEALHVALIAIGIPPDKRFFGQIPLNWLFDGADLALLLGIGVVGVNAVIRSYRGSAG